MRTSLLVVAAQLLAFGEAIWPEPAQMTNGSSTLGISPGVKVSYVPLAVPYPIRRSINRLGARATEVDHEDLIQKAIARFQVTLEKSAYVPWKFYERGLDFEPSDLNSAPQIESVEIVQIAGNSTGNSTSGSSYKDESYSLTVGEDGATKIEAATAYGAMHGLNTLTQLFYKTAEGGKLYTTLAPLAIEDQPTYGWRGFNVDLSRNFQSPERVKHLIDGLAFNKFSRLHIHATDSQAWPLVIPAFPDLARKGAYSPELIWSPEALKDVQTYAAERGIDSYIEIDSPGHTASIYWTQPELIVGYDLQPWGGSATTPSYCNEPPCGQVKLNDQGVTDFFEKLYADLLPRVKPFSEYFHSGGDEVNSNTYSFDEGISSNDSTVIQPYLAKFMDNLHSLIQAQGMKQLVWEEMILVWNLTLPVENTLVQAWQPGSLPELLKKGYNTIFGEYNYWYLDCGYGQWIDPNTTNVDTPIIPPYADYCSPQKSWRQVYAYDPRINTTEAEQELIQGGEVHLWGELTDPVNFDVKAWPRASAAGEVLWSGPKGVDGVDESVTRRLADMRERMIGLGFEPHTVQMTFCLQSPGSCSL